MTTLFNFNLAKSTGVIYYSKNNIIRKFSLTTNKRKLLNEYKGFKWYFKKSKIKIKNKAPLIEYFKNENYLNLPLIKGNKVPFWISIKETKNLIEILISHYLKVWPKNNITPYHGDLTIDNVLFENLNNPIIIDWEFFQKNELWGLDICHLLISSVVLPSLFKKKRKIPSSELEVFEILWKNFFKQRKIYYLKEPIKYLSQVNKKKLFKEKENDFIQKISNFQKKQILEVIKK